MHVIVGIVALIVLAMLVMTDPVAWGGMVGTFALLGVFNGLQRRYPNSPTPWILAIGGLVCLWALLLL